MGVINFLKWVDRAMGGIWIGSAVAALLVFMLLGFVSDKIFGVGGHHGHDEPLAFALEIEEDAGAEEEEETVDLAALVGSVDLAAGEKVFSKCKACHKVDDGANGVGPHLWGIVGRDIGSVGDYAYGSHLASVEGDWTLESLSAFLENPKSWAPGTKMSFSGLKDPEDRVNLIAWLNESDGTPIELAAASVVEAIETVSDAVEDGAEAATEAVEEATEAAEETVAAVTEEATEATEEAVEEATEEVTEEVAAATGDSPFAPLLAAADAKAGKKVFRKCRACHKLEEGQNGVGPSLWGVVGRDKGALDGFSFSEAMSSQGGTWTLEELDAFLTKPKDYVPGTKMAFGGIKDPQDRVNVITYINQEDGSPEPLQ